MVQSEDPFMAGGANHISLYEAQRNYIKFGACEKRFIKNVRSITDIDVKDISWTLVECPDREYSVEIDLKGIKSIRDLHSILKEKFDFPQFYGMNWDAFWDAITGLVSMPMIIRFKGWYDFEIEFAKDARILKELFDDFNTEYPDISSQVFFN